MKTIKPSRLIGGLGIAFIAGVLIWSIVEIMSPQARWPARELDAVGRVNSAVLLYAHDNDSWLPYDLDALDEDALRLPDSFSLEMFIYVAPVASTVELPSATATVLFPYEGAVVIGRLDGSTVVRVGGYSDHDPYAFQRKVALYKSAFGVIIFTSIIIGVIAWSRLFRKPLELWHLVLIIFGFFVLVSFNMRFLVS